MANFAVLKSGKVRSGGERTQLEHSPGEKTEQSGREFYCPGFLSLVLHDNETETFTAPLFLQGFYCNK